MLKRLVFSCMVIFTVLVAGGCAHPKPEFNQTYLPDTVPGAPEKRIELTAQVVDAIAKKGQLPDPDIKALPLSLHWIEDDNLLFSFLSKNRRKTVQSFLVTYSTGQIKVIEDAEKNVLLSNIENKYIEDNTGSSLAKLAKFAVQLTIAIAGGGSSGGSGGGEHFQGKLEINGYVLDIDATVDSGKAIWALFSSFDTCQYEISNRQTGKTLKGKVKIEKRGKEQESLENWLKSWRISPDGRLYLIKKTATLIVPENGEDTLIENYPYAALDISPKWDKIALIIMKEDEITKQVHYWMEFYSFWPGNNKIN